MMVRAHDTKGCERMLHDTVFKLSAVTHVRFERRVERSEGRGCAADQVGRAWSTLGVRLRAAEKSCGKAVQPTVHTSPLLRERMNACPARRPQTPDLLQPLPPWRRAAKALVMAFTMVIAGCGGTDDPAAPTAVAQADSMSSAPAAARARARGSRLAGTQSFGTFYGVPDRSTLDRLAQLDLAIVQPNAVNADQIRTLQTTGKAISYLAIGEIGDSNTYYDKGRPVLGITIRQAHPEWFVGKNPNFDSYFANPTSDGWRNFLVDQAQFVLGRGFDGLFLDTVDTVDVFSDENKAAFKIDTPVTLAEAKRGFIGIVNALRAVNRNTSLISNRGFTILLDADNNGRGTQRDIDAVMYEVASTVYYAPGATGELDPNSGTNPDFYWSWPGYLDKRVERGELTVAQRDRQVADNLTLDRLANAYRAAGGVVLAQDFATPSRVDLVCQSAARAKANGWVAAYSDIGFRQLYDLPESTPELRSVSGCEGYDRVVAPSFRLNFSPRVANVGQGRSKTLEVGIDSIKGYTHPVQLRLGALPTGVSAVLSGNRATPGSASGVTLTLNVGADVPRGEYIVPIRASSHHIVKQYSLRLVVNDAKESLWITNAGNFSVQVFDTPSSLTAQSLPDRAFSDTSLFAQLYAVAVDGAGRQYVVENTSPAAPDGRVLRYGALDSSAPELRIDAGLNRPTGVTIGADGLVWVANSGLLPNGVPTSKPPDIVALDPRTGIAVASLQLDYTVYGYPKQLAFDRSGNLWVTTTFGFVLGYRDLASAPTRFAVIGDSFPGARYINTVNGLLFDAAGNLWLSGDLNGAGRLLRVRGGSWAGDGSVTTLSPNMVEAQLSRGIYDPWGIALDASGNLWVVNQTDVSGRGNGSLVRFDGTPLADDSLPSLVLPQSSRFSLGLAIAAP